MGINRNDDNNLRAGLGCLFTMIWVAGALVSLTVLGVIVWAVIRLVVAYT